MNTRGGRDGEWVYVNYEYMYMDQTGVWVTNDI